MSTIPDAAGRLRLYQPPDPPPGALLTYPVPDGLRWRIICLRGIFSPDANVANRRLFTYVTKHTYGMNRTIAQYVIPAGAAQVFQFVSDGRNSTGEITNFHVTRIPMPLYVDDHCTIEVDVDAIQVGDTLTFFGLMVEEWMEHSMNP